MQKAYLQNEGLQSQESLPTGNNIPLNQNQKPSEPIRNYSLANQVAGPTALPIQNAQDNFPNNAQVQYIDSRNLQQFLQNQNPGQGNFIYVLQNPQPPQQDPVVINYQPNVNVVAPIVNPEDVEAQVKPTEVPLAPGEKEISLTYPPWSCCNSGNTCQCPTEKKRGNCCSLCCFVFLCVLSWIAYLMVCYYAIVILLFALFCAGYASSSRREVVVVEEERSSCNIF